MASIKKPTSITPRNIKAHYGGWVPKDRAVLNKWIDKEITQIELTRKARGLGDGYLSPVVQEFRDLIENDPEIYMYFVQMYEQISKPDDGLRKVTTYQYLMKVFDHYIHQAPFYEVLNWDDSNDDEKPIIGVPIYAFLDSVVNTVAGASAFRNTKVNAQFKKMFDVWSRYLVSPASRSVLTEDEKGWLGPGALQALDEASGGKLQDLYVCDTSLPHWGFTSWDHFYARPFRAGARPVDCAEDDCAINAACESTPYCILPNVKPLDQFWIKGQPYSLNFMLNNDPLASQFACGTVYQAFLSPLNYHRWHSPVNGKIIKSYVVPGTYYAASPDDEGPGALVRSQAYETALAARAIVFIESVNPKIGLMCFIAVGMAEVSSCDLTVKDGDLLKKGDELGTFHFGGSTHCLVFRQEAGVQFVDEAKPKEEPEDTKTVRVNSMIAHVGSSQPN